MGQARLAAPNIFLIFPVKKETINRAYLESSSQCKEPQKLRMVLNWLTSHKKETSLGDRFLNYKQFHKKQQNTEPLWCMVQNAHSQGRVNTGVLARDKNE